MIRIVFFLTFLLFFLFRLMAGPLAHAISYEEEDKLSKRVLAQVFKYKTVIKDPVVDRYLAGLGKTLSQAFSASPFPYRFYVLKDNDLNAFAIPGGHIFIYSGLVSAMQSEDELAGILAHEMAHVVMRHISRNIERSKKIAAGTVAGILAGIFLGGPVAEGLITTSIAAGQQFSLAYSREDEMQADEIALSCLKKAGFSAKGLVSILKKIRKKEIYGPDQIPRYLMTHPAVSDRIAYLSGHVSEEAVQGYGFEFAKARTRLVALYQPEQIAAAEFQERLFKDPEDPIANYGAGLLSGRKREWKKAVLYLKKALSTRAFDTDILADLGRILYLSGDVEKALGLLRSAAYSGSSNYEAFLYYGRACLDTHRIKEAEQALVQAEPSKDPRVFFFLAQAYSRLGRPALSHLYLGRYYLALKEISTARFHFKKAAADRSDSATSEKAEEELFRLEKKD